MYMHYNYNKLYSNFCEDLITPASILDLCKGDLSSLKVKDIEKLASLLSVSEEFAANRHAPSHEVLFHVLYNWHCKNPTATKRKLASLMENDLYKQAVKLNPKCKLDHYPPYTEMHIE
jgi:hypothetical protein